MLTEWDVEKYLPAASLPAIDNPELDPCSPSQTSDTCPKEKPADGYLPYDSSSREKTLRLKTEHIAVPHREHY